MAWLSHFGGLEQTVSLARTTAGEVEYVMVREAVAGARTHLVLHAAALRQGDGAVLVTGESGAGKTTLSLLLRAEGLTLLSDDLCPLDPVSGLISPLPRPLHLDGTYPPEALVGLPDPLPGLDPDRSPFPFEPESHPERQVPGGVHVILALERGDGGPDTVQALTGAETTQLLLRSLIRSRGTHLPEVIPALAGLARSARAWRIMSSTPHGALQCALRVLNRRVTDGAGSHS